MRATPAPISAAPTAWPAAQAIENSDIPVARDCGAISVAFVCSVLCIE